METLSSRVRLAWLGRALSGALIVGGLLSVVAVVFGDGPVAVPPAAGPVAFAVLVVLGGAHTIARYRVWGFELGRDALYIERGVLTRVRTVVPYVRVQHVDTQRGPVERALGLARLVVYTAGSRSADVTIPGLTPARADALQERLRDLAIESEHEDAV